MKYYRIVLIIGRECQYYSLAIRNRNGVCDAVLVVVNTAYAVICLILDIIYSLMRKGIYAMASTYNTCHYNQGKQV